MRVEEEVWFSGGEGVVFGDGFEKLGGSGDRDDEPFSGLSGDVVGGLDVEGVADRDVEPSFVNFGGEDELGEGKGGGDGREGFGGGGCVEVADGEVVLLGPAIDDGRLGCVSERDEDFAEPCACLFLGFDGLVSLFGGDQAFFDHPVADSLVFAHVVARWGLSPVKLSARTLVFFTGLGVGGRGCACVFGWRLFRFPVVIGGFVRSLGGLSRRPAGCREGCLVGFLIY